MRTILMTAVLVLVAALANGCDAMDEEPASTEPEPATPATTVDEGDVEDGDVEPTELPLEAIGDSELAGTVSVVPVEGGELELMIKLDDIAEVHGASAQLGSCADVGGAGVGDELLDEATSFTLHDVEQGTMQQTVDLPDDIVKDGTYALVVHEGDEVDSEPAACADVVVEED